MAASTSERIKRARAAEEEFRDVDVTLDADVRVQVTELDDRIGSSEAEIAALEDEKERITPDLRLGDPRVAEIDTRIGEIRAAVGALEEERDALQQHTLVTLRFRRMDGGEWAEIAGRHPARINVTIDRISNYNYHDVAREAAPRSGAVLHPDGSLEELTAEDWAGLFEVITGREFEWIAESLWDLNDFGARRRVDAARKVSTDGSGSRSS